jgi:hypothetical protein
MNILIRLLPIILISIIFYLLIYNLYPRYQQTIDLVKKLNELQNREKEINALEALRNSLAQNPNVQQLLANKEILNLWLSDQPKIEELIASLNGIYQANNLVFKGTEFKILEEPKVLNPNVLPLKVISFSLQAKLDNYNLMNFLNSLEKNVRIMVIKKAKLSATENSELEVENYFISSP